jgi:hypothetical protein
MAALEARLRPSFAYSENYFRYAIDSVTALTPASAGFFFSEHGAGFGRGVRHSRVPGGVSGWSHRMSRTHRLAAHSVAGLAIAAIIGFAQAQVPKPTPIEEQIRLFNSMSPEQQRALIRELQRTLPPAQREAIIKLLQGGDPEANTAR